MGISITPDFWNPIIQKQISCWDLAESYFDVGQNVYQEITTDGNLSIYETIVTIRDVSLFYTVLKIISYITVILPLIMLAIKCYYRQKPREWVIIPSQVRTTTQAVRDKLTKYPVEVNLKSLISNLDPNLQYYTHQWLTSADCARLSLTSRQMFRNVFDSAIWRQQRNKQAPLNTSNLRNPENYSMLASLTERPMDVVRLQTAMSYHYFLNEDQVKKMIFIAKTLSSRPCAIVATALERWIDHYSTISDTCFISFALTQCAASTMTSIPPRFFTSAAQKLRSLNITNAKLGSISEDIGKLTLLMHLSLVNNRLVHLPESLGYLTSLWMLLLTDNLLDSLPDSFGNLTGLGWLDLAKNKFSQFPEAIMKLSKMQRLTLSNNLLTELPVNIDQLTELSDLEIDGNQFNKPLPETLANLRRLNHLKISRKHIPLLPATMQHQRFIDAVD